MGTLITTSHARELVTLRENVVVPLDVLQKLWDVESRGASFNVTENGFNITPPHGMILVRSSQKTVLTEGARSRHVLVCTPRSTDYSVLNDLQIEQPNGSFARIEYPCGMGAT